jgi:hypothetical protein
MSALFARCKWARLGLRLARFYGNLKEFSREFPATAVRTAASCPDPMSGKCFAEALLKCGCSS